MLFFREFNNEKGTVRKNWRNIKLTVSLQKVDPSRDSHYDF